MVWTRLSRTVAVSGCHNEFAVQTSNFSAEYGQAGSSMFNVTMKSGSNALHGSGYEYLVNEAFNADRAYTNDSPRSRRHDYGFNVGGPVYIPRLRRPRQDVLLF
jgi:hypothetical protein